MSPTLPLFPTDDGWPYPDAALEPAVDDDIDLDALELRFDPHAYSDLTELEYFVVTPSTAGGSVSASLARAGYLGLSGGVSAG